MFCLFSQPSENTLFMPLYKSVVISPTVRAAPPPKRLKYNKKSYTQGVNGHHSYGRILWKRDGPEQEKRLQRKGVLHVINGMVKGNTEQLMTMIHIIRSEEIK